MIVSVKLGEIVENHCILKLLLKYLYVIILNSYRTSNN